MPVHHRLRFLTFPMRTSRLCSLWPDMRPLRFRRAPFGRDVAFDPGGATASRIAMPHMLPSTVPSVSASAKFFLSWLNPTPHPITVYASHPPSPTTAQHSLPGGALPPYRGRSFTGRNASASPDAPEPEVRIHLPPAESPREPDRRRGARPYARRDGLSPIGLPWVSDDVDCARPWAVRSTAATLSRATRRDSPSFVQIGLCRVGHLACRFRSARGVRTQFCTSDDRISAEILGSRRTRVSVPRALEGIKTPSPSGIRWGYTKNDAADRTRQTAGLAARPRVFSRPCLRGSLQARRTSDPRRHPDFPAGRARRSDALPGRASLGLGLCRRPPRHGGVVIRVPSIPTAPGRRVRQDDGDPGLQSPHLRPRTDRLDATPLGRDRGDRCNRAGHRDARADAQLCPPDPTRGDPDRRQVPHPRWHDPPADSRYSVDCDGAGDPVSHLARGHRDLRPVLFDLPCSALPPDQRRRAPAGPARRCLLVDGNDRRPCQAAKGSENAPSRAVGRDYCRYRHYVSAAHCVGCALQPTIGSQAAAHAEFSLYRGGRVGG